MQYPSFHNRLAQLSPSSPVYVLAAAHILSGRLAPLDVSKWPASTEVTCGGDFPLAGHKPCLPAYLIQQLVHEYKHLATKRDGGGDDKGGQTPGSAEKTPGSAEKTPGSASVKRKRVEAQPLPPGALVSDAPLKLSDFQSDVPLKMKCRFPGEVCNVSDEEVVTVRSSQSEGGGFRNDSSPGAALSQPACAPVKRGGGGPERQEPPGAEYPFRQTLLLSNAGRGCPSVHVRPGPFQPRAGWQVERHWVHFPGPCHAAAGRGGLLRHGRGQVPRDPRVWQRLRSEASTQSHQEIRGGECSFGLWH